MLNGLDPDRVLEALEVLKEQPAGEQRALRIVQDYNLTNVSEKVIRILHSYVHYVNRVVWHRV
jgi:UDP-N-acetylglucosamine 2-epimerase (non-hydrolysing)